jgi:hypothetical protein
MPPSSTLDVGRDVHNDASAVASVANAQDAEVIDLGPSGPGQADIAHLVRQRPSTAHPRVLVDEAGPCGYGRSRDLTPTGDACGVVAPALRPQQAGARGTPDRRAAVQLARLRRSGDLTPVSGPAVEDDAIRAVRRGREEAIGELKAATFRRHAVLRRQDRRDTGRAPWGPAPVRWLAEVVCATPARPLGFQADVRAVTEPPDRRQWLEPARAPAAAGRGAPRLAWGAVHGRRDQRRRTGRLDPRRAAPPTAETAGADPLRTCQGRATPAGLAHQRRAHAGPPRPGRRRLGLPLSRPRESPLATPVGAAPQADPRPPWEGARTAVHTRSPPTRPRPTRPPGRRRHGPGLAGLEVGHGHPGTADTGGRHEAWPSAPPLRTVATARGRGAAPVGCTPRRRDATKRQPRASREAGPRRLPGRWSPPPGEQPEHPPDGRAPALPLEPVPTRTSPCSTPPENFSAGS